MRRTTTLLVAAFAVASLCVPAAHARAPRGEHGVLVFLSDRDSTATAFNDDLYATTDLGRTVVRLTDDPAVDIFPAVSPDGRWLAWVSDRDTVRFPNPAGTTALFVCRLRLEGPRAGCTAIRRVTDPAADTVVHPAWAPDGRTLVFALTTGGDSDIHRVAVRRGAVPVRLFDEGEQPASPDLQPTVSPDGSTVLWARGGTLWAGRLDGTVLGPWTTGPANNPDYSPDGSQVVFTARRAPDVDLDVYVMRAEPEGVRNVAVNLTDELLATGGVVSFDRWARFSPDGSRIAFWSATDASSTNGETYVMRADGSGKVNVSDNDDQDNEAGYPVAETVLDWGGGHRGRR